MLAWLCIRHTSLNNRLNVSGKRWSGACFNCGEKQRLLQVLVQCREYEGKRDILARVTKYGLTLNSLLSLTPGTQSASRVALAFLGVTDLTSRIRFFKRSFKKNSQLNPADGSNALNLQAANKHNRRRKRRPRLPVAISESWWLVLMWLKAGSSSANVNFLQEVWTTQPKKTKPWLSWQKPKRKSNPRSLSSARYLGEQSLNKLSIAVCQLLVSQLFTLTWSVSLNHVTNTRPVASFYLAARNLIKSCWYGPQYGYTTVEHCHIIQRLQQFCSDRLYCTAGENILYLLD